jgi:hypothetical protein
MDFKIIDIQRDEGLDCYSILTVVSISSFMPFINPIHKNNGNIEEQRGVLSTRSAKIIRNQMVEDLKGGGILPPIVLGSIHKSKVNEKNFSEIILQKAKDNEISILDGMQRIKALEIATKEVTTEEREINHNLRVEFWFASDEAALLYRMLVLNSGQIPWSLEKQLEVVFKPVLKNLERTSQEQPINQSDSLWSNFDILEMFLAFTSRKVRIDKKQQLAEYHAALDVMSLIRDRSGEIISKFEDILRIMMEFDRLLQEIGNRYVFNNQTARIGFIVACAEKIFGLLGNDDEKDHLKVSDNFSYTISKLEEIKHQIQQKDIENKTDFLGLDLLKEMLHSIPKEKHRQAFLDGFKVLLSESEINTLSVCWKRM